MKTKPWILLLSGLTILLSNCVTQPTPDTKKKDPFHDNHHHMRMHRLRTGPPRMANFAANSALAGTWVTTPSGHTLIENIRIGQRVSGPHSAPALPKTPESGPWEQALIELTKPAGDGLHIYHISLLRQAGWMARHGLGKIGACGNFELDGFGLKGTATVLLLEPSPPPQSGPGHLVVSTIAGFSHTLQNLVFDDANANLVATMGHKFHLSGENKWVTTEELRPGDILSTKTGQVTLLSKTPLGRDDEAFSFITEHGSAHYLGKAGLWSRTP